MESAAAECYSSNGSGGGGGGGPLAVGTLQGFAETDAGELDGTGHYFLKKAFHKLVYCSQCGEMIWGFLGQGYVCDVCNFVVHEKCVKTVNVPCSTLAPILVDAPVAHVWIEVDHSAKRRFCNVCRKHLHDEAALRCEVCEYYIHQDCLHFALNRCKRSATFHRDEPNVSTILQSLLSEEERTYLKPFDYDRSYSLFRSGGSTPNRSRSASNSPSPGTSPTRNRSPSVEPLLNASANHGPSPAQPSGQNQTLTPCPFSLQRHHFTEQVPPHGSKCRVCRKAIFGECLNSLKCEWCQTTIHSGCIHPIQNTICDFGTLANLMLPPTAVFLPLADYTMPQPNSASHQTRSGSRGASDLHKIEEHWEHRIQSEREREKELKEQKDKEEDHIRVYDGNGGIRNLQYQSVFVPKTALTSEVLELALRQFHISGDWRKQFCLSELPEKESQKRRLEDILPFRLQLRGDAENPSVVLRDAEINGDTTSVRVYFDTAITRFVRSFQQREKERRSSSDFLSVCGGNSNLQDNASISQSATTSSFNSGTQQKPPLTMEVPLYRIVTINRETKARELLHAALQKLGNHKLLQLYERSASSANLDVNINSSKEQLFGMRMTDQSNGSVQERVLAPDEPVYTVVQQIRKESVYRFYVLRFTLMFSRYWGAGRHSSSDSDVEVDHGERASDSARACSQIPLFVSNMKPDLSQRQYERLLLDKLGQDCKWASIDVIYYEYGTLVLLYSNACKAGRALQILKSTTIDDKPLLALLLPHIHTALLPTNSEPLVVFVNTKSGGCQGTELLQSLRRVLNPHQVMNLEYGGPLPGLYMLRNVKQYKIMICGGDGSISWVLSCLDNVSQDAQCQSPPISLVPLGTGNDLSRVLNWGAGYNSNEDLISTLTDVANAEKVKLDRWTVIFYCAPEKEKEQRERERSVDLSAELSSALEPVHSSASGHHLSEIASDLSTVGAEDSCEIVVMNNYFGIGIDADVCLGFHLAREEHPDRFNSRLHNKGMYFKIGLRKIVASDRRSCKDMHKQIRAELDGKPLDVPPCEGLIVLNISSWGSGANPWGTEREDEHSRPAHDDGLFEIVAITGVVHMGQIQSGLRSGIRVAQGSRLKLVLLNDLPVQVDGEPWIQPASQIVISRSALTATMLRKVKYVPPAMTNKSKRGLHHVHHSKHHQAVLHQHSATAIDMPVAQERAAYLRVGRSLDESIHQCNQECGKQ